MNKCPFLPCIGCPYQTQQNIAMGENGSAQPTLPTADRSSDSNVLCSDAFFRVLHAAPNVPTLDLYIDGELSLDELSYGTLAGYIPLCAGPHKIELFPFGKTNAPLVSKNFTLREDTYSTIAAVGGPVEMELFYTEDCDKLVPKNTGLVKFVQLSPNLDTIDLVTDGGDVLTQGLDYLDQTPYVNILPQQYHVQIRPAGLTTAFLTIPDFSVNGGEAYSFYILGLADGNPPLIAALVEDMI